jgi:hypothetical protein
MKPKKPNKTPILHPAPTRNNVKIRIFEPAKNKIDFRKLHTMSKAESNVPIYLFTGTL